MFRRFLQVFVVLVVFVSVLGCSTDPVVDASSEEAFEASTKKMYESLDGERKDRFQKSLALLLLSAVDLKEVMAGAATGNEDYKTKAMQSLEGMTADQVIAQADQVIKEREEKMRQQALAEIAELQAEKKAAEEARAELEKFKILKSRFYKQQGFVGAEPVIELSVENGTEYPISRVYCEAVLASPGRAIPWLTDRFNYSIPGGLEPGEKADWSLAPNMFSEWGEVDAPKDAILTVTVYRLDGAEEKQLFSSEFSERKEERLKELIEKYQ